MNEWIEVNLPWYIEMPDYEYQDYPELLDRMKAEHGTTFDELEKDTFGDVEFSLDSSVWAKFSEISNELRLEYNYDEAKVVEKLAELDVPEVQAILKYREKNQILNEWYHNQPEVVAAMKKNDEAFAEAKLKQKSLCFSVQDVAKAGTLMEIESEGQIKYLLIGHINEVGGSCDDCRGISDSDIVKRYKIIWNGK